MIQLDNGEERKSEMKQMTLLKKGQPQEEDRYMWGCGLRPHPHIYPFLLLEGRLFSAGAQMKLTVIHSRYIVVLESKAVP